MDTKQYGSLRTKLNRRMTDMGYDSISDFWRSSGVDVSLETVRRSITSGRPVSVENLIKIMVALDFSIGDIKKAITGLGDTFWSRLISEDHPSELTNAWFDIIHKILSAGERPKRQFISVIELIAQAEGLDIQNTLKKLERLEVKT